METVIHLMDKKIERIQADIQKTIAETRAQTDEVVSRVDQMKADIRARNAEMSRQQFKILEGGKP